MKKLVYLFVVLAVVSGCVASASPAQQGNLRVINDSTAKIYSIGIQSSVGSQGGGNADNSPLRRGDYLDFDLEGTCTFTVELYPNSPNMGAPFARQDFTWNFRQGKLVLRIKDEGSGVKIVEETP